MTATRKFTPNATSTATANRAPLEQLASLFSSIASKASEIDRLCYFGADGEAHLQLTLDFVRAAVKQMGWLADVGSTKLGDQGHGLGPLRDSPEEWLLPPAYAAQSAAAATVQ
jgi:hypothetical protein